MSTVWLLEYGSFGDNDRIGVFSSRERAVEAAGNLVAETECQPDMFIITELTIDHVDPDSHQ